MYKLTIFGRAYQWHDGTYDAIKTEAHFNCKTLQQLTGLLEFMIATSENELELLIAKSEDNDDE